MCWCVRYKESLCHDISFCYEVCHLADIAGTALLTPFRLSSHSNSNDRVPDLWLNYNAVTNHANCYHASFRNGDMSYDNLQRNVTTLWDLVGHFVKWLLVSENVSSTQPLTVEKCHVKFVVITERADDLASSCASTLFIHRDNDQVRMSYIYGADTRLTLNKMTQTTSSDAFSWMKNRIFLFEFHRSLFVRVQLTKSQHCFR